MEALWKLEDKMHMSTGKAAGLFVIIAFVTVGTCMVTVARKMARWRGRVDPELCNAIAEWPEQERNCSRLAGVLMDSVRWSSAAQRADSSAIPPPPPLVIGPEAEEWASHKSASPVWQRPILMGGKCELPRFSGLILYDERGQPQLPVPGEEEITHQEKSAGMRITLQDLLYISLG